MAGRKVGVKVALLLTVVGFVAGVVVGSVLLGDVGRTPCWQVTADLRAARDTLSATFGGGERGAAALDTLRQAAQRRPDCFSPTERELFNVVPQPGGTDFATEALSR